MFLNFCFSNWGHLVHLYLFRSYLISFNSFLHIGPCLSDVYKYVFAIASNYFYFFSVYVVPNKICKFIYLFFLLMHVGKLFSSFYGLYLGPLGFYVYKIIRHIMYLILLFTPITSFLILLYQLKLLNTYIYIIYICIYIIIMIMIGILVFFFYLDDFIISTLTVIFVILGDFMLYQHLFYIVFIKQLLGLIKFPFTAIQ